jgi:hypothetical protein
LRSGESEIITDNYFDLNKLLLVNDKNYILNKKELISKSPDYRYNCLFNLIEKARTEFLSDFNNIRVNFEHNQLLLDKYEVILEGNSKKIIEPKLGNKNLSFAINYYYENILELIEKLMCYYYGINAYVNSSGGLNLFIEKDFDYSKLIYKYHLSPLHFDNYLVCNYD